MVVGLFFFRLSSLVEFGFLVDQVFLFVWLFVWLFVCVPVFAPLLLRCSFQNDRSTLSSTNTE